MRIIAGKFKGTSIYGSKDRKIRPLKDMVKEIYKRITPETIIGSVSSYFNVPSEDLKRGKRNKNVVRPRQIAMYLIRELTELSLPEIGRVFGAKHHTTVLYAHKKIKGDFKKDEKLKLNIKLFWFKIEKIFLIRIY